MKPLYLQAAETIKGAILRSLVISEETFQVRLNSAVATAEFKKLPTGRFFDDLWKLL